MLSKQIEGAQKKVEEQNFLIRKRVLEYDDVMNQQREIVYEYRDRILEGEDMSETAREQIRDVIERHRATSTSRATTSRTGTSTGLFTQLEQMCPARRSTSTTSTANSLDRDELDRGAAARTWSRPTTSARRSSARS